MFKIKYPNILLQKSFETVLTTNKTPVLNCVRPIKSRPSANTTENLDRNKSKQNVNKRPLGESWGNLSDANRKENEKEFLVRVKNDPDLFGGVIEPEILDEGDVLEEKYYTEQPAPQKRLRTKQYADIIKDFIKQRKIKEAIDVLEVRMLKNDRVKPEAYIYNLLLGACGRVGYTKKAFALYNDMKKRGLNVMGGTYTALFNACANSPWPTTDGLTRAKHLYDLMIEKGYQPNDTNYHAMIKAFGRCGDLPMAFKLVDEMSRLGFSLKADTMNFLLQACISDKEAGFRHGLLVWRKMIEKNIAPNLYTFNLLLRCTRDSGLGDVETTRDVIQKIVGEECRDSSNVLCLSDETGDEEKQSNSAMVSNWQESNGARPDLLCEKPHLGNILSISEVKSPEDRLLLLGGCKNFLDTMIRYKCTPDIKTFTQLLDVIPSTNVAEKDLIATMKRLNVIPDIDFFNMLIKKKSMRCDYERAKEVLVSMKQMKYRPNLVTYGVLALGCKTKEDALDVLAEMNSFGYTLNVVILGAMLKQACYHRQYDYIFEVMELCLKQSVPANKQLLDNLDQFKKWGKAQLEAHTFNKREAAMFTIFLKRHKTWLTEVHIDDTEDIHPWQQFRQNSTDENIKYKPKDGVRFPRRHSSLFKVKTSTKTRAS
ncbi:hypothetical protein GWI33_013878 [Rhynchophorus ferrugineus]|uniref:PROP1-like PPR domain-containing protein n=1 Tax=Rhynchophorus ferrugineus TaxID=354439 RepID=A0A834I8C8_RHYFE|nr:hypothetical protein GWI33_013878 [Rhynchophorus ferrugineus]